MEWREELRLGRAMSCASVLAHRGRQEEPPGIGIKIDITILGKWLFDSVVKLMLTIPVSPPCS